MAFASRAMNSGHLRQTSVSGGALAGMSLQARVNEKREELEHLKQLRDLSAAVATQMEALEEKLSTLADGTEGAWAGLGEISTGVGLTSGASNRNGHGQLA